MILIKVIEGLYAILTVQDLRKYFAVRGGLLHTMQAEVKAVDGVSFDVHPGEILERFPSNCMDPTLVILGGKRLSAYRHHTYE
jgi:hypothetical protein